MKKINELKANINEVEIFEMPEVKLIGKEIRCGGVLGNRAPELWDICIKDGSLDVIKALPSVVPNALLGWSGNYTEEDKLFSYIVGVFTSADTVVPKGFAWRSLPATLVAKGIYNTGYSMVEVYKKMGYTQNYELRGWNSEIYFYKDDPEPFRKWSQLTPVRLTAGE
jgi:predicted transcriptional regulator YdeE